MTATTAQTLRVHGIPKPQGSKTAFVCGGKPIIAEAGTKQSRSKHAAWRQAVATAARDLLEAGGHTYPASQPLDVGIDFVLPKPGSAPKYVRWVCGRGSCARTRGGGVMFACEFALWSLCVIVVAVVMVALIGSSPDVGVGFAIGSFSGFYAGWRAYRERGAA